MSTWSLVPRVPRFLLSFLPSNRRPPFSLNHSPFQKYWSFSLFLFLSLYPDMTVHCCQCHRHSCYVRFEKFERWGHQIIHSCSIVSVREWWQGKVLKDRIYTRNWNPGIDGKGKNVDREVMYRVKIIAQENHHWQGETNDRAGCESFDLSRTKFRRQKDIHLLTCLYGGTGRSELWMNRGKDRRRQTHTHISPAYLVSLIRKSLRERSQRVRTCTRACACMHLIVDNAHSRKKESKRYRLCGFCE